MHLETVLTLIYTAKVMQTNAYDRSPWEAFKAIRSCEVACPVEALKMDACGLVLTPNPSVPPGPRACTVAYITVSKNGTSGRKWPYLDTY